MTFDVDEALAKLRARAKGAAPTTTEGPAPTKKRGRRPPRYLSGEERLARALAEREALRAAGEVPPLPDPCGKDRRDRALRYYAYEDARRRRDAGEATPEELAYLEARFAHLSAWRRAKNARRRRGADSAQEDAPRPERTAKRKKRRKQRRAARSVFAATAAADPARLRGPDDLRALFEAAAGGGTPDPT